MFPQIFLLGAASSSLISSSSSAFRLWTPLLNGAEAEALSSSSFLISARVRPLGRSEFTTDEESVCHPPTPVTSRLSSSGSSTPRATSCSACAFLCAAALILGGSGAEDLPRFFTPAMPDFVPAAWESLPLTRPLSRATSSLARCWSLCSRSCFLCRSRSDRWMLFWCFPVDSWFLRSPGVSRTYVSQNLHQ